MEITKNKLTHEQEDFFHRLKNYIEEPIYFYGSVQRSDYLPGKSDLDIDIFSDNEETTIYKLCNFLNLKKTDFKKSVYKIDNKIIKGYKVKYKDQNIKLKAEISIYNEKYKEIILKEHSQNLEVPFYISILLMILKLLYYKLNLISKETLKRVKRFLMNENDELKFIVLDIK
jgi:hypothetical protein